MSKDLFGNTIKEKGLTSVQRMLIRQTDLIGRDLYVTEPRDIERFLNAIEADGMRLIEPIWEPAAGHGHISKALKKYGYNVASSDIIPYKDDEINIHEADFLAQKKPKLASTIFTNPPFNMQELFLEHALSMGVHVVFFVRLSFLSSIRRYKIYQKYNPAYVYVYTARAHCYKNGDTSKSQNMIDYCVIMWKPPYKTETIMRWIP
ncbi:MAG: hypothetical protein LBQ89_08000 [Treponema sp.]|jgi:ribosome biogenesis protein Nip4|nr:hypothetical protein [Treponema sp.]